MDIQKIAISQIRAAAYNPRKDLKPGDPEYEKLKKSLAEFDLVEPLIWNKRSGNLVGGHQRLKVLQERGDKEVQVSVVDLDDKKEKALNLALNKISGEWDFPLLKDLLLELDDGSLPDIEVTGFSEKEIEDLMTQFHVPGEGLTDDDEIPEQVETVCKKGDLWQLGSHRLLCGDATVITDVERLMGGEKADALISDPPYGIGFDTDYTRFTAPKTTQFAGKNKKHPRVRGDDAPFDPTPYLGFDAVVMFGANYYADKLPRGTWLVWDKRFVNGKAWLSDAELAWMKGGTGVYIFSLTSQGMVRPEPVQHPTQKAVALMEWVIEKAKAGKVVYDPFGGSGSTLIACEKLGRRCYMMEISEAYCDVIRTRWEKFTGRKAELVK